MSRRQRRSGKLRPILARLSPSLADARRRLHLWRWLVPVVLILLVIAHEFTLGHWLQREYGYRGHALGDILLFGSVGPVLAFVVLDFLDRWLQERETSELQSQMMDRLRNEVARSHELSDEAVQVLFSTSTLIDILKAEQCDLAPETAAQIDAAEKALDRSIRDLRRHLLAQSARAPQSPQSA